MNINALVREAIDVIPLRGGLRFDEIVRWVRAAEPDADVCAIDKAARPYQRGEPGSYTYGRPREGEDDDPGEHIASCAWREPEHGGSPFGYERQAMLPGMVV